ncbi:MAG: ROK family protein [Deltaproteobacteria bacterium]
MPNRKDHIVGVDLGGTSMRALVVDASYQILGEDKRRTKVKDKPRKLIEEIADLVEEAVDKAEEKWSAIRAVSIGAPGSVDPERGIVHHAPNLGWHEVRLGEKLKDILGVPVLVENDVNVGVVGEHALGAAQGAHDVVGIFVGTGIGGGIILKDELYDGFRGAAGELGHMILQIDGPQCGCGRRGCAEALASRTAMERDVRAAIKKGRRSVVLDIMKEREQTRMTSRIIQLALRRHDHVMKHVMKQAQHYLGILVSNVVNLLDPECVVIGGGIVDRLHDDFVKPIREVAYKHFLQQRDAQRVKILAGLLGDNAGGLGAVVLARHRLGI